MGPFLMTDSSDQTQKGGKGQQVVDFYEAKLEEKEGTIQILSAVMTPVELRVSLANLTIN